SLRSVQRSLSADASATPGPEQRRGADRASASAAVPRAQRLRYRGYLSERRAPALAAGRRPCAGDGRHHRRLTSAGADLRCRVRDEPRRRHERGGQSARLHGRVAEPPPVADELDGEHAGVLPHASAPRTSVAGQLFASTRSTNEVTAASTSLRFVSLKISCRAPG